MADFVVSLSHDGRISSQGDLSSALAQDQGLLSEINKERQEMENDEQSSRDQINEGDVKKPSGQLIVEEEVVEGRVGWSSCSSFL